MKKASYARLEGKTVVPVDSIFELLDYFKEGSDKRRIAKTQIGDVTVSTVFLCLNHGAFRYDGPDLWFETMIFGGPLDEDCLRYETYEEAERGHEEMVARVKELSQ